MPTLEELRRWARGRYVQGMPKPLRKKPIDKPELTGKQSRQYRVDPNGEDALLLFGSFRGSTCSQLRKTPRGRKYLRWILDANQDFETDLKEVCRYQLELWKREKAKRKKGT